MIEDNYTINNSNVENESSNFEKEQEKLEKTNQQPSFLVDLRQPKGSSSIENLDNEEKILNEQHPQKNPSEKNTIGINIWN